MIKRVVALVAAIIGVLLASLAPAVAIPDTPAATTPTFDFVHHSTPTASVVTERGPPGAHELTAVYDYNAGDRWSRGAFVRSERATSSVAYSYDDSRRLAQVARGVPTAERRVQATRAIFGALSRGGVAAETAPLDWSIVSKTGETRAAHVALHEAENASKMAHGVFIGDSQALTNEASSIAQARGITPISEGGVDIYRVPMGRNVGYAGGANAGEMAQVPHRTIEIITRGGTNELITGYPVPLG